ncbi:RNA polymerase sigma factor, partial [Parabacteroides goldsteinii]
MYNNSEQEKILIAGLIQDDESAFCELYALYKNRLMFFAMKFLKSKEFAEDVFQDAFTSVWQNRR